MVHGIAQLVAGNLRELREVLVALLADGHVAALKILNLKNNEVGDAGASALAAVLSEGRALTKLKALRLEGNRVGDAGAEALAAAIRGGGGAIELCPLLGTSSKSTHIFFCGHTLMSARSPKL